MFELKLMCAADEDDTMTVRPGTHNGEIALAVEMIEGKTGTDTVDPTSILVYLDLDSVTALFAILGVWIRSQGAGHGA